MKLLAPFGKLYSRIMDVRNLLYDRDVLKSYALGARTISVGNLTTGGTGKTPLVSLIAKTLIDEGEAVCILTRGYGRKHPKKRVIVSDGERVLVNAETGGDEPVELAYKLEGKAIIVADPDRVAAAKWARENFPVTAFILDDGFQHRRARRDLDIVCIDATDPCGNGYVLPAGTLRESFKSLKRADAIVITRTEQVESTIDLEKRLRDRNSTASIFTARTELQGFLALEEFHAKTQRAQRIQLDRPYAFTGIGNPANFFRTVENSGTRLNYKCELEDHFKYSEESIKTINAMAKFEDSNCLITTAKDAVKLKELQFELPCYIAIAETVIDDIDAFKKLVTSS